MTISMYSSWTSNEFIIIASLLTADDVYVIVVQGKCHNKVNLFESQFEKKYIGIVVKMKRIE